MCQSHGAGLQRESVHGQASKNCCVSDGLLSLVLVNPSTLSVSTLFSYPDIVDVMITQCVNQETQITSCLRVSLQNYHQCRPVE